MSVRSVGSMNFFKQHIRWMIPIIGVLFFGITMGLISKESEPFEPTQNYEVQMADELYYSDETIKEWIDSVRGEKGVHQKTIDKFKYLLICAGTQVNDQAALALVDTIQTNKTIKVVYALVGADAEASNKEVQPFMLVRIPSHSSLKLVAKEISESQIPDYFAKNTNSTSAN